MFKLEQDDLIENIIRAVDEARHKGWSDFLLKGDLRILLHDYEEQLYDSWGQQEIDDLKSKIEDLEDDKSDLKEELEDVEEQLSEAREKNKELEEQLDEANAQLTALGGEVIY